MKKKLTARERKAVAVAVAEEIIQTQLTYAASVMVKRSKTKYCGCYLCRRMLRERARYCGGVSIHEVFLLLRGDLILRGKATHGRQMRVDRVPKWPMARVQK